MAFERSELMAVEIRSRLYGCYIVADFHLVARLSFFVYIYSNRHVRFLIYLATFVAI